MLQDKAFEMFFILKYLIQVLERNLLSLEMSLDFLLSGPLHF